MPSSHDEFVSAFTDFLTEVVENHRGHRADDPEIVRVLSEHLGADPRSLNVVTERLSPARFVDSDIALYVVAPDVAPQGIDLDNHGATLAEILRGRGGSGGLVPARFESFPVGPDKTRQVATQGLRLVTFEGHPVAVLQRDAVPHWGWDTPTLEVIAVDPATAARFLDLVRRTMLEHSVLRGAVVSFAPDQYGSSTGRLTFHRRPQVSADQLVLGDGVLERLERHVLGIGRRRDVLLAAGQHLKRGVLLYGPPGTGKTHTVRYLTGRAEGVTTVLLNGLSLMLVGEATRIARAMHPAIVVLEDCDLIAEDRHSHAGSHPALFELLEALDGVDGDADVAFVLTTNRPDLLEHALTQRPGRIDLAVEIDRPDEAGRRALLELYAAGLGLAEDTLAAAAARAEGVTASFVKELVRRAVLTAAEQRGPLTDALFLDALDGLLADGERLTRSLLNGDAGTPVGPAPFQYGPVGPGIAPGHVSSLTIDLD